MSWLILVSSWKKVCFFTLFLGLLNPAPKELKTMAQCTINNILQHKTNWRILSKLYLKISRTWGLTWLSCDFYKNPDLSILKTDDVCLDTLDLTSLDLWQNGHIFANHQKKCRSFTASIIEHQTMLMLLLTLLLEYMCQSTSQVVWFNMLFQCSASILLYALFSM